MINYFRQILYFYQKIAKNIVKHRNESQNYYNIPVAVSILHFYFNRWGYIKVKIFLLHIYYGAICHIRQFFIKHT